VFILFLSKHRTDLLFWKSLRYTQMPNSIAFPKHNFALIQRVGNLASPCFRLNMPSYIMLGLWINLSPYKWIDFFNMLVHCRANMAVDWISEPVCLYHLFQTSHESLSFDLKSLHVQSIQGFPTIVYMEIGFVTHSPTATDMLFLNPLKYGHAIHLLLWFNSVVLCKKNLDYETTSFVFSA